MFTAFSEASLNMKGPSGYETRWFRGCGDSSPMRHTDMIDKALVWNADLICFVGADQVHQEDMLQKLVNRIDEGYSVISATVPMRGHVDGQESKPFQAMAWRFVEETKSFQSIDLSQGTVQPIDVIGSGVLMFPASAIKKMKKPWFEYLHDSNLSKKTGGCDSKFVWNLNRQAGYQVYVDTTIKVQHANVFLIDDTYSDRFSDWGEENKGEVKWLTQ